MSDDTPGVQTWDQYNEKQVALYKSLLVKMETVPYFSFGNKALCIIRPSQLF